MVGQSKEKIMSHGLISNPDEDRPKGQSLIATGSGDFNNVMTEIKEIMAQTLSTLSAETQSNVQNLKEAMKGCEAKYDRKTNFQAIVEPTRLVFNVEVIEGFVKDK
jgi:hypothetical protein